MNDPKNIQNEAYVDQLFRLAVLLAAEKEGKTNLALEENAPASPLLPSDIQRTTMKRKLRKHALVQETKFLCRGAWHVNQKVSAYLVAFILVCAGTLGSADAVRSRFLELFLTPQEEYSSVQLVVYDEEGNIIEGRTQDFFVDFPVPQYIPDGMFAKQLSVTEDYSFVEYQDSNGKLLGYSVKAGNRTNLDTENAPTSKKIIINGEDGFLISKDDFIMLTWTTDDSIFTLKGSIDENELITIAKSVK